LNTVNIVICGLGGQGILFMTRILSEYALRRGIPVLGAETHGMAQRGGSVVSHLRLGNTKSSLVPAGKAGFLLALDPWEAYRSLSFLAEGALLCVNSPDGDFPNDAVKTYMTRHGIACFAANAGRIAGRMGAPLSTNLALLGVFSSLPNISPYSHEGLGETIGLVSPDRFREVNLKVFEAGFEEGKRH
jgi:indolepyruvate ferredoxin oxidoreductase beta subunit